MFTRRRFLKLAAAAAAGLLAGKAGKAEAVQFVQEDELTPEELAECCPEFRAVEWCEEGHICKKDISVKSDDSPPWSGEVLQEWLESKTFTCWPEGAITVGVRRCNAQ